MNVPPLVFRGLSGLDAVAPDWERLSRRIGSRGFHRSLACFEALLRYRRNDASSVWFFCFRDEAGQVAAICPLEPVRCRIRRFPFWAWQIPSDPDRPSTDFVVDPELEAGELVAALSSLLREIEPRAAVLIFDRAEPGSVPAKLAEEKIGSGIHAATQGQVARLATSQSFAQLLESLPKNLRTNLRRRMRWISEHGNLVHLISIGPHEAADALEDFIRLEAAGWKGQDERGRALLRNPKLLAYVRSMVPALAARKACEVHLLKLNDECIAGSVCLIGGREVYCFKTAYSETWGKGSPGQLLKAYVLKSLCERSEIDWFNVGWESTGIADWNPSYSPVTEVHVPLGGWRSKASTALLRLGSGSIER